jgi:hypothetical protein
MLSGAEPDIVLTFLRENLLCYVGGDIILLRRRDIGAPGLGEHQRARGPLEELRAEMGFEIADLRLTVANGTRRSLLAAEEVPLSTTRTKMIMSWSRCILSR